MTFLATAGLAASGILLAAILGPSAPASASPSPDTFTTEPGQISPTLVSQAISEARAENAIASEIEQSDGSRVVQIRAASGASLELVQSRSESRLSAGNDSYGFWIGFNSFDQGLILSGAGAGLGAGLCLLGPAVCAVSTIALVIAGQALASNGGIRCGSKVLRVYPSGNHKPRCV